MTATQETPLSDLRERRTIVQGMIDSLEAELKEINAAMLKQLETLPEESLVENGLKATIIRPKRTNYDWDAIQKAVGLVKWKQIVDLVPNKDKAAKVLDASILAKHSTVLALSAYVKVSKAREEEDVD